MPKPTPKKRKINHRNIERKHKKNRKEKHPLTFQSPHHRFSVLFNWSHMELLCPKKNSKGCVIGHCGLLGLSPRTKAAFAIRLWGATGLFGWRAVDGRRMGRFVYKAKNCYKDLPKLCWLTFDDISIWWPFVVEIQQKHWTFRRKKWLFGWLVIAIHRFYPILIRFFGKNVQGRSGKFSGPMNHECLELVHHLSIRNWVPVQSKCKTFMMIPFIIFI